MSTAYELLGGAAGVERLVETFYDVVEQSPAGAPLLVMHLRGHGMAHARAAQFEFMSGFLGGPQLYREHHGHNDVRQPHTHLEIGVVERDAWLACMQQTLDKLDIEPELAAKLMKSFTRVAEILRNKP